MTSLTPPKLGTDPTSGWQYYSLHLTGSYVLKEFFLASNYQTCIAAAEAAQGEIGAWARQMRTESYHELYTHCFVGMWTAFEAGVEDTAAAFIKNSRQAATSAASRFKNGRYSVADWPWSDDICSEIVQKLEQRAKEATPNGGFDLYSRYRTMFSWLLIELPEDQGLSEALAGTALMRNIIVHRYGRIGEGDVRLQPGLAPWSGRVMPIDQALFAYYYSSMKDLVLALMNAIDRSIHAAA